MKFLALSAFWFSAAIPVVVVFYLLKRKRTVRLVSSTLLWQKFLAENQANSPFQKLRHNWLLLLQLFLLLLSILALSRPYFFGSVKSSALRVVILDASASMQSVDESPSRFEKGRAEISQLIGGMRDEDQMVILQAAANTEVKQSATSDKAALRRALKSCSVTDAATHLKEALKLAGTLTRSRPDAEIHLFSDGAANDLTEFENKNVNFAFHRIGQRSDNIGIIALDIRSNPDDPKQRAIYASVQNFSANLHEAELELQFGGKLIEVRPLKFAGKETSPQIFFVEQVADGLFTLKLKVNDDLAADNEASIFSALPQPAKILLVTRGNRFLEKALRGAANVQLSVASELSHPAPEFDLTVLDDIVPAVWPTGNLLAIHVSRTNWFESVSTAENPSIVDWKNTHPLLRYVNFDNVQISETLKIKSPSWALPLVDAQQTPLLLSGEFGHQKIVWVGFDTLQSTWPLRVSFPIFIANAVDFLGSSSAANTLSFLRAGETYRFARAQP
ncbi:MAG: BatA and WFA domain-containing protein, partial [Verrucomicrobiota bacterium]